MSFSKHEVAGKLSVTGEIGEKLDAAKETADNKVQQLVGGRSALLESAKLSEKILLTVDTDMEDGKFPVGATDLEVASYVKRKVIQVIEGMRNYADKLQSERFIAEGQAAAYRNAVEIIQKYHNAAKIRHLQLQQAELELKLVQQDSVVSEEEATEARRKRAPGEHPGPSPLNERRQAAALERAEKEEETTPEIDKETTPSVRTRKKRVRVSS